MGVSNYSLAQIDRLTQVCGEAPAVNQIPWSPARHDPALLAAHAERGVAVEGYSPLKGTNLADPVLVDIAKAHGVTPAQVVLRWHIEHGITVIPKSVNPERIAANFDLMRFSLEPDQVARIERSPGAEGRAPGSIARGSAAHRVRAGRYRGPLPALAWDGRR